MLIGLLPSPCGSSPIPIRTTARLVTPWPAAIQPAWLQTPFEISGCTSSQGPFVSTVQQTRVPQAAASAVVLRFQLSRSARSSDSNLLRWVTH